MADWPKTYKQFLPHWEVVDQFPQWMDPSYVVTDFDPTNTDCDLVVGDATAEIEDVEDSVLPWSALPVLRPPELIRVKLKFNHVTRLLHGLRR